MDCLIVVVETSLPKEAYYTVWCSGIMYEVVPVTVIVAPKLWEHSRSAINYFAPVLGVQNELLCTGKVIKKVITLHHQPITTLLTLHLQCHYKTNHAWYNKQCIPDLACASCVPQGNVPEGCMMIPSQQKK